MLSSGCTAESPEARAVVERQLAAATQRAEESQANPMRPMLGRWVVDLDATLAENPSLLEDEKDAVRKDLMTYPFELTITDQDYVSRSSAMTQSDRYHVLDVNGPSVTIALSSADGIERRADRKTTLRVRDGKLLIQTRPPITCVMSRPVTGGG
jgi:hypothetical protein